MEQNEIRAWTGEKEDKHPHVLGQMRVQGMENGEHVIVLEVYRNAVDLDAVAPAEVDICNVLYGKSLIRCNVDGCDYVGIWHFRLARKKSAVVYMPE